MNFQQEPYLYPINEHNHRVAFSRLCDSLHKLEIERGRHGRPKKTNNIQSWLCSHCSLIEDELQFVCQCMINEDAKECIYNKTNEV